MKKRLLRKGGGQEKSSGSADLTAFGSKRHDPRILVVDDSLMVRNFHSYILKDAGFEVRTAADGAEALERFLGEAFDLIVTDINMPNMDGITFIKKVREVDPNVPIIIISTEDEAEDKQLGYDAGANIYLVKPTKPSVLIESIRILL